LLDLEIPHMDLVLFPTSPREDDIFYTGFAFGVDVKAEDLMELTQYFKDYNQGVKWCFDQLLDHYQSLPARKKTKRKKKKKNKTSKAAQGKAGANAAHGKTPKSRRAIDVLKRALKRELCRRGFLARQANSIIGEADKFIKGKIGAAKYQVKLKTRALKVVSKNYDKNFDRIRKLKSQIGFWTEMIQGRHILWVRKELHVKLSKLGLRLHAETDVGKRKELQQQFDIARAQFDQARNRPITQIGYGKEEAHGQWTGNKTIGIIEKDGKLFLMVKLPVKTLSDGTRLRRELMLPIHPMKERNAKLFEEAKARKAAITYQISFDEDKRGGVHCYGTFKMEKGAVLPFHKNRRIGIDQNAGFITVALVEGDRVIWVVKRRLKQRGCAQARLEKLYALCKELIAMSVRHEAPLVLEDLKLAGKARRGSHETNYKISNIPYGKFQETIRRLAYAGGVTVFVVNPFHTSTLARVSFPGMDVHLGAAVQVAWRQLKIPEARARMRWNNDSTCDIRVNIPGAPRNPVIRVSENAGKALRSKGSSPTLWSWVLAQAGQVARRMQTEVVGRDGVTNMDVQDNAGPEKSPPLDPVQVIHL
jgi:IS605 OrfB family transposase